MRIALFALGLLGSGLAQGQHVIDVDKNDRTVTNQTFYDAGGYPVSNTKYVSVTGSPYFSETWMRADITTEAGTLFPNVRVKLNFVEGTMLYLTSSDQEMISVIDVKRLEMTDTTNGKKYSFLHLSKEGGASKDKVWYQILKEGTMSAYKQQFEDIYETKPYGSSITQQEIQSSDRFYIDLKGTLTRVKSMKDVMALAGDKVGALTDYAKANKLSGKKETDYAAIAEYYNTLK